MLTEFLQLIFERMETLQPIIPITEYKKDSLPDLIFPHVHSEWELKFKKYGDAASRQIKNLMLLRWNFNKSIFYLSFCVKNIEKIQYLI